MKRHYYSGIGSRETPYEVCKWMYRIASKLSKKNFILRSGGADGADTFFEDGSNGICEIYLPWFRFNDSESTLFNVSDAALETVDQFHPAPSRLSNAARKLHARNAQIILGSDLKTPSEFVVCWTKHGLTSGGTAQGIRIAQAYNVPIVNLGCITKSEADRRIEQLVKKSRLK